MNANFNQDLIDNGLLSVAVYANSMEKPVDNSTVRVTPSGNGDKVIAAVTSDSSGQTPEIELAAPPIELSMNEEAQERPYSEYDVTVMAEGFEPMVIEGVQILPGAQALQNVYLQETDQVRAEPDVIQIPDNTLWGSYEPKIPEEPVKPLPPSTGFVVLPEPVIPEYIVVHAGAPSNASAQNYWVPFKEYIKNVASCEIYANWPEETLKANVLAIISFTLNRVYTEWYRGKGYNFTITSSTAYDHAFTYGRNIFDEISNVVDEIFTTYITKPDIRQPLLAQYCDGKKSQCPTWMTQWGSKYLGDQGYPAVDILKKYYGYDIYLTQAKSVQGVPASFGGETLTQGSSGVDVRTIQQQLNVISDNYPAIGKLRVDGVYGQATVDAVKKFQGIFKMPSSGMVDFATWYKISDIFVAVTRLAELG